MHTFSSVNKTTSLILKSIESSGRSDLSDCKTKGYVNGRNDLVVGEDENMRKFSGSAYKLSNSGFFKP
jgi:lipoate-protein ligase A